MNHRIKGLIKRIVCSLLYYSGMVTVYRSLLPRQGVSILFFHQMDARRFEMCVRYLQKHYRIISLSEFVESQQKGRLAAKNTAVLTFDDGYRSNYTENYPILVEYGVPATGFLTADFVGTSERFWWDKVNYIMTRTAAQRIAFAGREWRLGSQAQRRRVAGELQEQLKTLSEAEKQTRIEALAQELQVQFGPPGPAEQSLSWEEAREMQENGVVFGGHTMSHPVLTRISLEHAERQIRACKEKLEGQLGRPIRYFAYPNGESGDFNEEIKRLVREAGFECALTTIRGTNGPNTDLYAVKRIPLPENMTRAMLATTLCGLWGILSGQY